MRKNIIAILMSVFISSTVIGCSKPTTNEAPKTTLAKTEAPNEASNLEKKSVFSNRIEILMPKNFAIMSDEIAKIKYPSNDRPTLIYTDEQGTINLSFKHTESKITKDELPQFKDEMKKVLQGQYPNAEWYDDQVADINGKRFGILELLTPAADQKIYNLMFFTDVDGKLLISSFNCTENHMKEWKPIAKQILNSTKIK